MRRALGSVRARVDRLSAAVRGQMVCSTCGSLRRIRWVESRAQLDAIRREPPDRCDACGRELSELVYHWLFEEV